MSIGHLIVKNNDKLSSIYQSMHQVSHYSSEKAQSTVPSEGVSWHHTHTELTRIISQWAHFEDTQLAHSELASSHCEIAAGFL